MVLSQRPKIDNITCNQGSAGIEEVNRDFIKLSIGYPEVVYLGVRKINMSTTSHLATLHAGTSVVC